MRQANMANLEEPHVYRLPGFRPREVMLKSVRNSIINLLNNDPVGFWTSLDAILDHPSHLKSYPRHIQAPEEWFFDVRYKAKVALEECRAIYVAQQQTPIGW